MTEITVDASRSMAAVPHAKSRMSDPIPRNRPILGVSALSIRNHVKYINEPCTGGDTRDKCLNMLAAPQHGVETIGTVGATREKSIVKVHKRGTVGDYGGSACG
jgi:hypothetical protein